MAYRRFVEDDEMFFESDQPSRPWLDAKETAKLLAWNRQELIANELSRLASDEYLEDIMQHLRHMEDETLADANLIDLQREIQWFMRPYLIDFLVEAHACFSLLPETLFLAVNLLDRYCSKRVVYKQHYQLVGCAALLISAKYGDKKERVPQIHELNNMCCGLYDPGMFTQMEMHVLNTLDWTIGHPTVDFFMQLLVAIERDDAEVEHMAAYLSEIALYHRDFVSTKPSVMARSSLALARAILGRPEVTDGEWSHVENVTLLTLSQHIHQPSISLSKKYASPQYSRVTSKLADFLRQQAAAARKVGPQTAGQPVSQVVEEPSVFATPGKGAAVKGFDGYMTPPFTPDGTGFDNGMAGECGLPPRCPATPTPAQGYTQGRHPMAMDYQ